jgi:6-phosphogluconolactonase (cycloisomerase 2 family)
MFHRLRLASTLLLLLLLSGCVISPRRGTTITGNTTGTGQLYIANESGNSILRFAGATAISGNASPTAVLAGNLTQLSLPRGIRIDAPNNRLYIANSGAGNILVFDNASTLTGNVNVAPTRAISSVNLTGPVDVARDSAKDLLYVADNLEVAVFGAASTINGSTPALRVIQLTFTPGAILSDSTNDRLFIADPTTNTINVLDGASIANGPLTPTRTITGPFTQLNGPGGLIIDGAGRLIVSNSFTPSITIYNNAAAASTAGNVSPVAVMSGSNTTLSSPAQLAIDPTTNAGELYVANSSGASVAVFSSITTVSGTINPQPNRSISGTNTTLNVASTATAAGVAIDTTH